MNPQYGPYGNQQLPFNHANPSIQLTVLQQPPVVFNLNQPPGSEQVIYALHLAIANETITQSNSNYARMFTLNQLASNNWNNNFYYEAVDFAFKLLALLVTRGSFRAPEEGIANVAQSTMRMFTSRNAMNYSQLYQMLPQPAQQSSAANVQQYNQYIAEFSNMHRVTQQPQQQYFQQPQQQVFGFNNQPSMNNFGNVGNVNNAIYNPQGSNFPMQTQSRFPVNQQIPVMDNNRFANALQSQSTPIQPIQVTQPVQPVVAQAPIQNNGELIWKPTSIQPYPICYQKHLGTVVKTQINSNNQPVVVYQVSQGGIMDRDQHTIGSVSTKALTQGASPQTRLTMLNSSIETFSTITKEDEVKVIADTEESLDKSLENAVLNVLPKALIVNYFDEAVFLGKMKCNEIKEYITSGTVYKANFILAKPVSLIKEVTEFANRVANSKNNLELYNRIKDGINSVNKEEAIYSYELSRYFTKVINDLIANRLSITNISISDFVEDYLEIASYIGKQFGTVYEDAVNNYDLCEFLIELEKDLVEELLLNLLDEDTKGSVSYIASNISITYLGVVKEELNLGFSQDGANQIMESSSPNLHKLVKSIFDNSSTNPSNSYLVLEDNTIYEIYKGLVGVESYLIRKVN